MLTDVHHWFFWKEYNNPVWKVDSGFFIEYWVYERKADNYDDPYNDLHINHHWDPQKKIKIHIQYVYVHASL